MTDDSDWFIGLRVINSTSFSSAELIDAMSFIALTDSQCDKVTRIDRQTSGDGDRERERVRVCVCVCVCDVLAVVTAHASSEAQQPPRPTRNSMM